MDRKTQQYIVLGGAGAAISTLAFVVFGVLGPKTEVISAFPKAAEGIDVSIVADRTSAAAPEMSWINQSKAELDDLRSAIEDLQKTLEARDADHAKELTDLREEYDSQLEQQILKIAALEQTAQSGTPSGAPGTSQGTGGYEPPDYADTGSEFITARTTPRATDRVVASPPGPLGNGRRETAVATANTPPNGGNAGTQASFGQSFSLATRETLEEDRPNTLRDYIPAGSYAPAVVLSGADAATNVSDRENPTPVLFRITGPAVTAATLGSSRGRRIDIEGCTVQGSAIGDLSSERVRVRLISMTCARRNGTLIETGIAGYMVGAGKAGVRGQVVSREGGLVSNAMIAGALQGLAGAIPGGSASSTETTNVAEIAQNAAAAAGAGGVQQAATTLSEYYINRAEQYQPVISLNGGTQVELVFMEGVDLK